MGGELVRALALGIRPQRIGVAVLEGSQRLVEWGTRKARYDDEARILKHLDALIERFDPDFLIVKNYKSGEAPKAARVAALLVERGLEWGVGFRKVSEEDVYLEYRQVEPNSRFEVAVAISRVFPELADRLPRPQVAWEREDDRMVVFEAVALGTAQLAREERERFHARMNQ